MNRFLLWIGEAVGSIWELLAGGTSWVLSKLEALLNPLLSPLFSLLNPLANLAGELSASALGFLPRWASLTVLSGLCGVGMLFVFKYLSNQRAIAAVKDDISANLLALKLYKDELRVTAMCQWRLLRAVVRLQRHMLKPVLIALLPMLLMLGQMGTCYQWEALPVGRSTLLRVVIAADGAGGHNLELDVPQEVRVEAGAVASSRDVVWRIRPLAGGEHTLTLRLGDEVVTKLLCAGSARTRVSAVRPARRWTSQLLYPIEPPIPSGCPMERIELEHQKAKSWFRGGDYWVVSFFVVSMAVALLLKPAVGVRL